MKNEKTLCKVLLDLSAFAFDQNPSDKTAREDYEEAFRLARKYDLQDLDSYSELMGGITSN